MIRKSLLLVAALLLGGCSSTSRALPEAPAASSEWKWTAPRGYVGMPAADRHGVVASYAKSWLIALDQRGRPQWEARDDSLRDVAPLLLDDAVVAATEIGLAAFDRADGQVRWRADVGDRSNTPVLADPYTLVTTTWDGRIVGVDLVSGARRWEYVLPDAVFGPPAARDGIAIATWSAGMTAVDVATGEPRWRIDLPVGGTSSPAAVGDVVVVVAGDAAAHAFDVATGQRQWRTEVGAEGSEEVPPAAARGGVVVADRLGNVAMLSAASGKLTWRAEGEGAAVRGGPAIATRRNQAVIALPVDDGRVLLAGPSRREIVDPGGRVSGVVATPDGLIVVATREVATNGLEAFRP